jgi:hypothetical protein
MGDGVTRAQHSTAQHSTAQQSANHIAWTNAVAVRHRTYMYRYHFTVKMRESYSEY